MSGRDRTEGDDRARVWEALLRTHAALVPLLAEDVEAATGLALSWYDVLLELSRAADGELRMSELGERVVLSRSRVSRIVDELVAHGLVDKRPDPADGRAALAALTTRGRRAFRHAAPTYLARIEARFTAHLNPGELEVIGAALSRVIAANVEPPPGRV